MTTGFRHDTARAAADRKGATTLEYALIMAAIAPVMVAGFTTYSARIETFILAILP